MRVNLLKCKLICPRYSPFHAKSSPTVRIRNWPIRRSDKFVKDFFGTLFGSIAYKEVRHQRAKQAFAE